MGTSSVAADPLIGDAILLRRDVTLQVCYQAGVSPAVVFLHGGLGNRFNWRSQYEFAIAQGWQTLVYDLGGHGQSSPYRRYSIGRHRRDLTRLLDLYGIQSPILCCHSYGVPIGLEWAQRHPTSGLILACGGTHDLDPWWEVPLMKFMQYGGRHLYRLAIVQQCSNWLGSRCSSPTIHQFFAECPTPTDYEAYKTLEIFWPYHFFRRLKSPHYTTIPTLVMSGGRDSMFSRQMGDELATHFQHSEHFHIPTAGHLIMAEYPQAVNQAIRSFRLSIASCPSR